MAIPILSPLIEFILLGPQDDRRQLQDFPVRGDVWIEFGKRPSEALDLLIAPYRGQNAGVVAATIHERRILCDSATDLGRERSFQGHGMLDVLRTLPSL
jgi:hypothetical protein